MLKYITLRLVMIPFLLVGVATVVFILFQFTPGDPISARFGLRISDFSPAQLERMREDLGLNDPIPVQYFRYIGNLMRGDLGISITSRRPVLEEILSRMPATLELALTSILLVTLLSVPLGFMAATWRGSILDNATTSLALVGFSMPSFWLGIMFILLFSIQFNVLPTSGRGEGIILNRLNHLVLPTLTLSLGLIGYNARIVRSAVLEVQNMDYVMTARSKGLKERQVLFRHILPNVLIPIVTVLGLQFAGLLGGAVIIEMIFAWPGIGRLAVNAVFRRDYPIILGTTIFFSAIYIVVNLIIDILYSVIDPRIRLE
ncbi:MAG: ABC transporter permease [Anaerolineae bacterium]|nr:ABC transporter permease [Anaerolineae bacterium]